MCVNDVPEVDFIKVHVLTSKKSSWKRARILPIQKKRANVTVRNAYPLQFRADFAAQRNSLAFIMRGRHLLIWNSAFETIYAAPATLRAYEPLSSGILQFTNAQTYLDVITNGVSVITERFRSSKPLRRIYNRFRFSV